MLAILLLALPAAARAELKTLVPPIPPGARSVNVFFVNDGSNPERLNAPQQLEAGGAILQPAEPANEEISVAPGGFAKVPYVVAPAAELASAREQSAPEPVLATPNARTGAASDTFLSRFSPHDPIYAVAGTGSDAAKLQMSIAFQPFRDEGLLDNLRLAYTQTLFWAIERPSSPFRTVTYSPEVHYVVPAEIGGQPVNLGFGYRHDSNGVGGAASRDVNRLFLRGVTRFDLGGDWSLDVAPSAWIYVRSGSRIDDYWGNAALQAAIEQRDGLKLSASLRGDLGRGRAGAEFLASYPLTAVSDGIGLYLFGQLWTGYGETLLEFDQKRTRARIGIGFIR